MGYLYLAISTVAFSALAISYKVSDRLDCDKPQANLFLFASATVSVALWAAVRQSLVWAPAAAALGAFLGPAAFVAVRAFREAVAKGRISTSSTVLQLSLVFPVVGAIFIWRELPDLKRSVGLALAAAAIVLLGIDMARSRE